MATNTTNFGLKKPAYTDTADIADINGNMDKVDVSLNGLADAVAIVAKNNTHGAITQGQYVYVHGHGSLAEGLYTAKSNIAANATLSTSNLTADASGGLNALNSNIISKAITLASISNDLNNATNPGIVMYSNAEAENVLNAPVARGGYVIVFKCDNNEIIQEYIRRRTEGIEFVYIRIKAQQNWSPWVNLPLKSDLDNITVARRANGTYQNADLNGIFGYVTSGGTELNIDVPMVLMSECNYVSVTSLTLGLRTSEGGYIGGANNFNATAYVTNAYLMKPQGVIHITCTKSDGWSVTNNTVCAGRLNMSYTLTS